MLTEAEKNTLNSLSELAEKNHTPIWVVGGVIRDSLLGNKQLLKDVDLVISGDARQFAYRVAESFSCRIKIFDPFLTAKLLGLPGIAELDLASLRQEHYSRAGALPSVCLGNFEQDSLRRDFSINALYMKLTDFIEKPWQISEDRIVDPVGGLPDLASRQLRVLHKQSFIDDPTRLFRAVRYKIKINGSFEDQTARLFSEAIKAGIIDSISKQRVFNEIAKICNEADCGKILSELATCGVLQKSQLLSVSNVDKFCNLTDKISNSGDFSYELICQVFYFLEDAQIREKKFLSMGFGRKFFKQAEQYISRFETELEGLK